MDVFSFYCFFKMCAKVKFLITVLYVNKKIGNVKVIYNACVFRTQPLVGEHQRLQKFHFIRTDVAYNALSFAFISDCEPWVSAALVVIPLWGIIPVVCQ